MEWGITTIKNKLFFELVSAVTVLKRYVKFVIYKCWRIFDVILWLMSVIFDHIVDVVKSEWKVHITYICIYLSIYLSVYLSIYLSIYLSSIQMTNLDINVMKLLAKLRNVDGNKSTCKQKLQSNCNTAWTLFKSKIKVHLKRKIQICLQSKT